jgi:hypothetical protein
MQIDSRQAQPDERRGLREVGERALVTILRHRWSLLSRVQKL